MMPFGTLNFSHTWYDPKGGIGSAEFVDMVDQFTSLQSQHSVDRYETQEPS